MFNLNKGVYFSQGTRTFCVSACNIKEGKFISVEFYNIHKPREIITQPMEKMMDLMSEGLIKYEGLSLNKKI